MWDIVDNSPIDTMDKVPDYSGCYGRRRGGSTIAVGLTILGSGISISGWVRCTVAASGRHFRCAVRMSSSHLPLLGRMFTDLVLVSHGDIGAIRSPGTCISSK